MGITEQPDARPGPAAHRRDVHRRVEEEPLHGQRGGQQQGGVGTRQGQHGDGHDVPEALARLFLPAVPYPHMKKLAQDTEGGHLHGEEQSLPPAGAEEGGKDNQGRGKGHKGLEVLTSCGGRQAGTGAHAHLPHAGVLDQAGGEDVGLEEGPAEKAEEEQGGEKVLPQSLRSQVLPDQHGGQQAAEEQVDKLSGKGADQLQHLHRGHEILLARRGGVQPVGEQAADEGDFLQPEEEAVAAHGRLHPEHIAYVLNHGVPLLSAVPPPGSQTQACG